MFKLLIRYSSLSLLSVLFLFTRVNSQNVTGGEISYKFLYRSGGEFPMNHYHVTIKLYKECQDIEGDLPSSVPLSVARINPDPVIPHYDGGTLYTHVPLTDFHITKADQNSCNPNQQPICYYVAEYSQDIGFLEDWGEYYLYVQSDVRKSGAFNNVSTDGIGKLSAGVMGYTITARIPGMLFTNIVTQPSSPVFKKEYPLILCAGQPFQYDFSAVDPDGDELSYAFVPAYQGYIYVTPRYPATADKPPFFFLFYYAAFSGASPLGSSVTLDPSSGRISGIAPPVPGKYLVAVEVTKTRNGTVVTRHRKEIQFIFSNCFYPRAQLDSTYKNCKGLDIKFSNYSTGNISKYFWDFGDPSTNADTSNLQEPSYHYPAPGTYTVKLLLNKGTTLCKDSAFATVIVDSGLNADFSALKSIAVCNQALYNFTNLSTQGINPINSYAWDFGEPSVTNDVSSMASPTYLYPTEGPKAVRLIIKNTLGCSDTAFKTIQASKSLLKAPPDTTICNLDNVPLNAFTNGYPGTFSWSPNYRISSLTSQSPLVNPQVDTTYYVTFTDATGCVTTDSVLVKVRSTVKIKIIQGDTTICRLDTIPITATHDGLNVTWRPAGYVTPVSPDGSQVNAFPYTTGDLIATAHFGSCIAEDTVFIKVVAQPQVTISSDTSVCLGAPVYLQATGGAFYLWAPASTLDDPLSPTPIAHPVAPTTYTVSVYDTLGCPKHTMATVRVNTFQGLIAIAEKDTMVVFGEPVQLNSNGGQYYHWSPSTWLSDPNISNPVARPMNDIVYTLRVSNDDGCADSTKVHIRAFKDADIYVPTAFTPNNDGLNDIFRVFPISFSLTELKIFDRWGNIVFATSDYTRGWDGKRNGIDVASGVYVWMASGKNIKTGAIVLKKGTITIIR